MVARRAKGVKHVNIPDLHLLISLCLQRMGYIYWYHAHLYLHTE